MYGSCLAARRSKLVGGVCSKMPYGVYIASVHSFFFKIYFLKNLVLINRRNGPRYQRVLAFCAFLTGAIPKGLILRIFLFDVCVCFLCICVGTDLLFWDNSWFDDLSAR